jgi:hypothetical protein
MEAKLNCALSRNQMSKKQQKKYICNKNK